MIISLKSVFPFSKLISEEQYYRHALSCVFLTNPGKQLQLHAALKGFASLMGPPVLVAIFCHCGEHSTPQLLLVIIIFGQLVPANMFEGRQHQLAAEVLAGSGICFMFMIHE